MVRRIVAWGLWFALSGYAVLSPLYVPYRAYEDRYVVVGVALLIWAAGGLVWLFLDRARIPAKADEAMPVRFVCGCIAIGVVARLAYVAIVPPVQLSDSLSYWNAAVRLVTEGRYYFPIPEGELLAWRPPGYPMLLAAFIWVFGTAAWIPLLINLLCFTATCLAAASITTILLGNRTAAMAVAGMLAIWPDAIAGAGLAVSEWPSLALLTVGFWAFLKAQVADPLYAVLAGLCTGYGILIRPGFLFLPVLWFVFAFLSGGQRRAVGTALLAATLSIAVVAPWTIRNHQVLGAIVPVSTNGGSVFYRANNPIATGGFAVRGERDIDRLRYDEVLWNRTGMAWGLDWIRENPVDFVVLIFKKQAIYTGSDTSWLYWSMERGQHYTGIWYRIASAVANAWWIGIVLLVLIAAFRARRYLIHHPLASLTIMTALYPVAVHSVFESQPRHHVPSIAFLALLAVMAVWPPGVPVGRDAGSAPQ